MANPSKLLIGVHMQPASNFSSWKARGINTIVTDKTKPDAPAETSQSRTAYFKAAADLGLQVIIGPDKAGAENDLVRPGFLAWCQPDEPENWGHTLKKPDGSFDWPATTAKYVAEYTRLKVISPSTPIFGNFNGDPLGGARETDVNSKNATLPTYREFAKGADWLASDRYVRARGRSAEEYRFIGQHQDRLALIKPNAPHFAYLECANQGLNSDKPPAPAAAPTPDEVRAQIWMVLIHGAKGFIYFPLKVAGGFSFDNTPPDVAAAMPGLHAEVLKYERLILEGQRVKNPTAEEATWTLPGIGTLTASMKWNGTAWDINIKGDIAPPPAPVDPEKEALKAENAALRGRLKRIDDWRGAYPSN